MKGEWSIVNREWSMVNGNTNTEYRTGEHGTGNEEVNTNTYRPEKKMIKAIKILIQILGWLSIAVCPTIIAGLISLVIYIKWKNIPVAVTVLVIGFVIGVIWATKISIKYGAAEWISRIRKIS